MLITMNLASPGPSKVEKNKNEYALNISSATKPQLLELLERQKKILASPAVRHLKDKGEKVKLLKQQIEEELAKRSEPDDIADELMKLTIKEKSVEFIEWGEKRNIDNTNKVNNKNGLLEDEKDPLAILASHSGTVHNKRQVNVEEPEEPLVTLADIEEAYALSLCTKIDQTALPKERFLPHRTLRQAKIPDKDGGGCGFPVSSKPPPPKTRDLSAATPPPPVFGDTKLLSLEESLRLQFKQNKHLKEVQMKHAAQRLKELKDYQLGEVELEGGVYRQPKEALSDHETDGENDEEDEE